MIEVDDLTRRVEGLEYEVDRLKNAPEHLSVSVIAYAAMVKERDSWMEVARREAVECERWANKRDELEAAVRRALESLQAKSVYTTPTHAGPEVLTEEKFVSVANLEATFKSVLGE